MVHPDHMFFRFLLQLYLKMFSTSREEGAEEGEEEKEAGASKEKKRKNRIFV